MAGVYRSALKQAMSLASRNPHQMRRAETALDQWHYSGQDAEMIHSHGTRCKSDEAVIGELQCTAYYHEMMTCRKNRVSVSSPMCIANVSWACITVMCIWKIVLSIRVLNWKWAHMLWFQCTADSSLMSVHWFPDICVV